MTKSNIQKELIKIQDTQNIKRTIPSHGCNKLFAHNWLKDIPQECLMRRNEYVEVKFKNSRKEILINVNKLRLEEGDIVVTETTSGHDVGIVSLVGDVVLFQAKAKGIDLKNDKLNKVYRRAKDNDIEKWKDAISLEVVTMFKARSHAEQLGLDMKICDVEYQGDKTKAIFYYTADGRVDFRALIKVFAENFKIRIEMRQIGARQEAGRLGGIGACGRELCCSTFHTNFSSVATSAARYQQLALNPLKLAGQCGKLKCCLQYEIDAYVEALADFPDTSVLLKTQKGNAFFQKLDVFKRLMWYSYEKDPSNFIEMTIDNVKIIIELNKKEKMPEELIVNQTTTNGDYVEKENSYQNVVGQDSLTRFDKSIKKSKNKKYGRNKKKRSSENNKNQK